MANPKLKEKLAELPASPGVYIMRDADGQVVYVGKAKSLKQRVRSYFQDESRLAPKTAAQMRVVEELEWIVVSSAMEALVLESNLIKEYAPKYNIMLRDDKHYPYLAVTLGEEYPRLIEVRSVKNDSSRYFGPYVSAGAMHITEKLLREIFPLRRCTNRSFRQQKRPCLNYHIGRCLAPCTGKVDKAAYREMCRQVVQFLEGKSSRMLADLQEQMHKASEELRFEEAAQLRDRIAAIKLVQSKQYMDAGSDNRDMLAVAMAEAESLAAVQVFFVREGKVVGREHFFLDNRGETTPERVLTAFICQYYSGVDFIPPEICLSEPLEDMQTVNDWLNQKRGGRVNLLAPKIGEKKRLLELVRHNAEIVLNRELEEQAYKKAARLWTSCSAFCSCRNRHGALNVLITAIGRAPIRCLRWSLFWAVSRPRRFTGICALRGKPTAMIIWLCGRRWPGGWVGASASGSSSKTASCGWRKRRWRNGRICC